MGLFDSLFGNQEPPSKGRTQPSGNTHNQEQMGIHPAGKPLMFKGRRLTSYSPRDTEAYQFVKDTDRERHRGTFGKPDYMDGIDYSILHVEDGEWCFKAFKAQVEDKAQDTRQSKLVDMIGLPANAENLNTYLLTFFYKGRENDPKPVMDQLSKKFNIPFTYSHTEGLSTVATIRFRHFNPEKATILSDIILQELAQFPESSLDRYRHANITLHDTTNGKIVWSVQLHQLHGWVMGLTEGYQETIEEVSMLVRRFGGR